MKLEARLLKTTFLLAHKDCKNGLLREMRGLEPTGRILYPCGDKKHFWTDDQWNEAISSWEVAELIADHPYIQEQAAKAI